MLCLQFVNAINYDPYGIWTSLKLVNASTIFCPAMVKANKKRTRKHIFMLNKLCLTQNSKQSNSLCISGRQRRWSKNIPRN